jgi:hypothetical protein
VWDAQSLVVPFKPPVGTRGSVRRAARVGEWDRSGPRADETRSWCGRVRRDELERSVRPMAVVMVDVSVEHALEVPSA